jgi:pimeloyl-ACP methyl ester carboxylesterase
MMARMIRTSHAKNSTIPGMAYPAMVLVLATAGSYPPMLDLIGRLADGLRRRRPGRDLATAPGLPADLSASLNGGELSGPRPAAVHASCEDYRAGAGIDLAHDQSDAVRPLSCPVLALWSKAGIGRGYDVEQIWAQRVLDLGGRALDCGHFLAEERPDETAAELLAFLTEDRP